MREAVLFIAMSLDGYIADSRGGVEWLQGQDEALGDGGAYETFIRSVDTVLMGFRTYQQIVTELSPDAWPYEGLTAYVFTHRKLPSTAQIRFTDEMPAALVERLRAGEGKRIWICGGADLARQLMREDLIDQYDLSVIPVVLGAGVRLFAQAEEMRKLRLIQTQTDNGVVRLTYVRR